MVMKGKLESQEKLLSPSKWAGCDGWTFFFFFFNLRHQTSHSGFWDNPHPQPPGIISPLDFGICSHKGLPSRATLNQNLK